MKALNLVGWISAGIGAVVVLIALISIVVGKNLFGIHHAVNCFQAANSFFLMAIAAFIVTHECSKKE